jgi:2-polyprenyl-3-methyl-5-hydroxy-6-metoxy-1,4-benzoquinol methylase
MEYINDTCMTCGSKDYNVVDAKVRFPHKGKPTQVRQCSHCGLMWLDSFWHIYDPEFKYQEDYISSFDAESTDIKRRLNIIGGFIEGKKLLDYGCGSGMFMMISQNKNCTGVEIHGERYKHLYDYFGLNVYDSISKTGYPFDVVTMFHVLEHLEFPVHELAEIAKAIVPGGYLFIETPNNNDTLIKHSKAFRDHTFRSEHLYVYNEGSLAMLLRNAGFHHFDIKHVQRYSEHNHNTWMKYCKGSGDFASDIDQDYVDKLIKEHTTDTLFAIIKI